MRIRFYATQSGRSPVEELISKLPDRLKAAILDTLERIIEFGLRAPGVSFRKIEGKLWELRIQSGGSVRFFYVVVAGFDETSWERALRDGPPPPEGEVMILLHGYLKQSQKAPVHELDVARNRMKELLK